MKKYFVNINAPFNGDHVVHLEDCRQRPLHEHSIFIGEFMSCEAAVISAKEKYSLVNGCKECTPGCYTAFRLN